MHYSILTKLSYWLLKNFEYCLNLNKKTEAVELSQLGNFIHQLLIGSGWITAPLALQILRGKDSYRFVERCEKFGFYCEDSDF